MNDLEKMILMVSNTNQDFKKYKSNDVIKLLIDSDNGSVLMTFDLEGKLINILPNF